MMKKCVILALMAGSAISATGVLAQELIPCAPGKRHIRVDPVGYPSRSGGYQQRDVLPVYSNQSAGGGFYLGNCVSSLDDIGFLDGPWELLGPGHTIKELVIDVMAFASPAVGEQVMAILWDKNDVNFQGFGGAGSNMVRPGATPIQVLRIDFPIGDTPAASIATEITIDTSGIAPDGGITIPATDDGFFLQVTWVTNSYVPSATPASGGNPDWSVMSANASGSTFGGCPFTASDRSTVYSNSNNAPAGGNPAAPGFSLRDYGRDIASPTLGLCGNIGSFIGNGGPPVAGGAVEHRFINSGGDAYAMNVAVKGDVTVTLPEPLIEALGCIPDAPVTQRTGSVAANSVAWYTFCSNGDIQDSFRQFFDIDTEGGGTGDVSLAVYAPNGVVMAFDNDSGSGSRDQLSFGVGRRPSAGGDGVQYDGRSGEFLAGTYYLAVAPAGAQFKFGFNVLPSGGPGGTYSLNMTTNNNNGALANSVPPIINAAHEVGNIDAGATTQPETLTKKGIIWYRFATGFDTATSGVYYDITTDGPGHAPGGDPQIWLFNNNGDIVASDDDNGPDALSQLSFSHPADQGGPADRCPHPAGVTTDGLPPAGQNGELAAGTYYLGVGMFEVTALANPGRWHLRATTATTTTVALSFSSGSGTQCPCCAADFNVDGGVTGDDVGAFFTEFENGTTCGDVDKDGGVTGADVEFFFSLFEAGGC